MSRNKVDVSKLNSTEKHEFEMTTFFAPKKAKSRKIAAAYRRIGDEQSAKAIYDCGSFLDFGHFSDDTNRLIHANFCKHRMCPMCAWRRSLKNFSHLSDVFSVLEETHEFVFLTLTEKNCTADELPERLSALCRQFVNLLRRDCMSVFDGAFRSVEVTYDGEKYITRDMYNRKKAYYDGLGLSVGDENPTYDTYHPHLHTILSAPKGSYFGGSAYMPFKEWLALWREIGGYDYDPSIRVNRIGNKTIYNPKSKRYVTVSLKKALKEVSKYSVKDEDFLKSDLPQEKADEVLKVLSDALHRRRLIAYYGIMKDLHKEFAVKKKINDDDLVSVTDEESNGAELEYRFAYRWQKDHKTGEFRYVNIDGNAPLGLPQPPPSA